MNEDDKPWTIGVPEAGKKYFGLSRQGSYDAVARGEIPVVRIGRLLRVPVRKLEQRLAGNLEPAA
jgi:hypothetical protein